MAGRHSSGREAPQACCGEPTGQAESRKAGVDRTSLPGMRPSGLGLCLTVATHYNHAPNMSITSQHVPIVEGLVDRHSPIQMGGSGLFLATVFMASLKLLHVSALRVSSRAACLLRLD
jgi:hypothetical protein